MAVPRLAAAAGTLRRCASPLDLTEREADAGSVDLQFGGCSVRTATTHRRSSSASARRGARSASTLPGSENASSAAALEAAVVPAACSATPRPTARSPPGRPARSRVARTRSPRKASTPTRPSYSSARYRGPCRANSKAPVEIVGGQSKVSPACPDLGVARGGGLGCRVCMHVPCGMPARLQLRLAWALADTHATHATRAITKVGAAAQVDRRRGGAVVPRVQRQGG